MLNTGYPTGNYNYKRFTCTRAGAGTRGIRARGCGLRICGYTYLMTRICGGHQYFPEHLDASWCLLLRLIAGNKTTKT